MNNGNPKPVSAARIPVLTVMLLLAACGVATSQSPPLPDYHTKGFSLGLHLNGTSWRLEQRDLDIDQTDGGGGLGFMLGYGVSNLVTLFFNVDGASISPEDGENYTLTSADLGARFTFGSGRGKLRPFVEAALSGAGTEIELEGANLEISGGGIGVGGGILYFFSRQFALDAGLDLVFGNLNSVKVGQVSVDPNISAFTTRLNVGFAWYPGK